VLVDLYRLRQQTAIMTNNDVLRRIRYVFDFNDAKMIAIFALADLSVKRNLVIAWLRKDDDPAFEECDDRILATFLNGFISEKRGKKPGPQPKPEQRLTNNIILMKLKIALSLQSTDIIALAELGGCKDQVLRYFLKGLQIKYRDQQSEKPTGKLLYGKLVN
jgi:uncharacterized protein YehS (DUF1456 family)